MAEANTLPWPSIEQLPREICRKVNRLLTVADAAAVTIQRRVRGEAHTAAGSFAGGYRHRLLLQLRGSPTSTAEKLDGTNVGILLGGKLLGRRLEIEDTATTYQRCTLAPLRALNAGAALHELSQGYQPKRSALYGELCCNAGLYSYGAQGIAKSWLAFGALLEFADEEAARAYVRAADAVGLVCGMSGTTTVRVCNNDAFGRLVTRHDIPAIGVSAEPHASLCAAVAHHAEWMMSERGEGLVLTVKAGSTAKLYKWKISREPQPAAVAELEELAAAMRDDVAKAALLGPEVVELSRRFFAWRPTWTPPPRARRSQPPARCPSSAPWTPLPCRPPSPRR